MLTIPLILNTSCNVHTKQFPGHVSRSIKIRRALWLVASALLFRPWAGKVFRPWRVALLRLWGADVTWDAEVYASAQVWAPWNLRMGRGACLGPHVVVYNQAMVTLDEDVCVSQQATLCTAGHDLHDPLAPHNNAQSGLVVAPISLHRGAWVGMQAFVGMGVEVGDYAVVGARACVFADVPQGAVVGGNPAKEIKNRTL